MRYKALLPGGNVIQLRHTAFLDIPRTQRDTRKAHIFPTLTHDALVSITQLCDHGSIAVFDALQIYIVKSDNIVMQGGQHPSTGLYNN